jgi:hypothetical protein
VYPEVAGKDVPLQSYHPNQAAPGEEQDGNLPPTPPWRYCGMSKKVFLIVLIAAVVLVVAIVAGAVGGAVSSRKSSKNTTSDTSIAPCTGSQ